MSIQPFSSGSARAVSVLLLFTLFTPGIGFLVAQDQQPPPLPPPNQVLTPDQLNDLVAPIALYPDPLLSQIMVASTYPLEVVQAYQWLQRSPGLTGPALTEAAQQQNWDPSVQALVIFPDVLKRLNDDVTWTTNLGNAFLAQQQDVMDAVQRMRQRAEQAGKLAPTPQENVIDTTDNGQPAIEIMPADPAVMYVPVYDPLWIWGPPLWYPYPRWYWPSRGVIVGGVGFGFGAGIDVGLFFGGGWHGWGGWGWHPGWGSHAIIVNNTFIHEHGFNSGHIADVHGNGVWQHDAAHRAGVPYARPELNNQYRGNVRQSVAPRSIPEEARGGSAQTERFGNRDIPRSFSPQQNNRGAFGGMEHGSAATTHAEHGYSSLGAARSSPGFRGGGAPSAPAARGGGGGRR